MRASRHRPDGCGNRIAPSQRARKTAWMRGSFTSSPHRKTLEVGTRAPIVVQRFPAGVGRFLAPLYVTRDGSAAPRADAHRLSPVSDFPNNPVNLAARPA